MASAVANVPAESDLLCESCGYVLNGLPDDTRCPECGVLIAESSPAHCRLPAWERSGVLSMGFFASTFQVLFFPRRFFRGLVTREGRRKSQLFAIIHMLLASLLFGISAYAHANRYVEFRDLPAMDWVIYHRGIGIPALTAVAFILFAIANPIAARLTSWEAGYRGLRMPLRVVRRGLDYHAAHYLPVAALAATTILGFCWLLDRPHPAWISVVTYLYTLCAEVILGAVYLFWTYWIGMRNMMYANA